jgi:endonuclease IV
MLLIEITFSLQHAVHNGKTDGAREKKLSQVVTDVCHMYGTGRGFTTDNFFTSCELADFL